MRHRKKKKILDRKRSPRKALLKNLATDLIIQEKIKTTLAKAKVVRPIAEKFITLGKESNLTTRRKIISYFQKQAIAKKILEVLGPRYKERKGGYTRIIKAGRRKGDGAEMAIIELLK